MKLHVACLAASGFVVLAEPAAAKDLYVDAATGDDTTTYDANDADHPFATLQRAVWGAATWETAVPEEAAQAGDIVHVLEGTYVGTSVGERYIPAFLPVNSGTEEAPIVIQAEGEVLLEHECGNQCPAELRGPLIGTCCDRSYIVWRGFTLDEANASYTNDTGLVVAFEVSGAVFEDLTVLGGTAIARDNHNGIRFELCTGCAARNNRIDGIYGVDGLPGHHNEAGLMLYGSDGVVIEHNEISNCGAGIFPKGSDNRNIVIRHNIVRDTKIGIRNTYTHPEEGENFAYQNVIIDCRPDGTGIQVNEFSFHWVFANNTIHNCNLGIELGYDEPRDDLVFQNNIVSGSLEGFSAGYSTAPLFPLDYNLYHDVTQWSHDQVAYQDLASWQTASAQDGHSFIDDPLFVDVQAGDVRLTADSPARDAGIDLLDLDGDGDTTDSIHIGADIGEPPIGGGGGTGEGGENSAGGGVTSGGGAPSGSGGNGGGDPASDAEDGGCECSAAGRSAPASGSLTVLLAFAALIHRRRRARRWAANGTPEPGSTTSPRSSSR
jgi:uncharacterized protein (TIGR03382 family)